MRLQYMQIRITVTRKGKKGRGAEEECGTMLLLRSRTYGRSFIGSHGSVQATTALGIVGGEGGVCGKGSIRSGRLGAHGSAIGTCRVAARRSGENAGGVPNAWIPALTGLGVARPAYRHRSDGACFPARMAGGRRASMCGAF